MPRQMTINTDEVNLKKGKIMFNRYLTKKAGIGIVLSAAMMMTSMTAFGANYTDSKLAAGTTTQFDKYLVMDEDANVPNAEFKYTITGTGNAKAYDVTGRKVQILDGIGTPTITWDSQGTEAGSVKFEPGNTTTTYAQHQNISNELVKDLTDGKKYAKHTATIDFSTISFPEPGIYRYKIEEANTVQQGITNDSNLVRYLDVYVTDNDGQLGVDGYILHSSATDAPMNITNGTEGIQDDDKSQGYTNSYETHDIIISKTVSGNQASRDKYFKFTVKIENAVPGTVFDVSLADDGNANTTDGNAEATPTVNTATVYESMRNVNSIAAGADGSVEQDFFLQHGQSIAIRGLAKDTKYTVTETQEDYKPAATATEGTVDEAGNKVTVDNIAVDSTIAFTNTRTGVIPTGVIVSILPYGIAGILAGTGFAVFHNKKKDEEEEE